MSRNCDTLDTLLPSLGKLTKDQKKAVAQAIRLISMQVRCEERDRFLSILEQQFADHPALPEVSALLGAR